MATSSVKLECPGRTPNDAPPRCPAFLQTGGAVPLVSTSLTSPPPAFMFLAMISAPAAPKPAHTRTATAPRDQVPLPSTLGQERRPQSHLPPRTDLQQLGNLHEGVLQQLRLRRVLALIQAAPPRALPLELRGARPARLAARLLELGQRVLAQALHQLGLEEASHTQACGQNQRLCRFISVSMVGNEAWSLW